MACKKILIMGLPGAGKTTLASKLVPILDAEWLSADKIREKYNDWDFSNEGRVRQAKRMRNLADDVLRKGNNVVVDFVCPTPEVRKLFNPDFIVWVNTIESSRFDDTNKVFVKPTKFDIEVKTQDSDYWAPIIAKKIYES